MSTKKLNLSTFIERAKKVHGDRYDYSESIYVNKRTKIKIKCSEHGYFYQTMNSHLKTGGCKNCGSEQGANKRSLAYENFIKRLPKDRDYEILGDYEKLSSKIIVKDKYSEHSIKGSLLVKGAALSLVTSTNKTLYIINKCNEVHENKYDYSLVEYRKDDRYINIICKDHGIFRQGFSHHMRGAGCRQCILLQRGKPDEIRIPKFIEKAESVHGNKYGYSRVVRINDKDKVDIECPTHGVFNQNMYTHLIGNGCPKCGRESTAQQLKDNPTGWSAKMWQESANKSKFFDSFKVYLIRCYGNEEEFYKVGRTFNTVERRFNASKKLPYAWEIEYIIEGNCNEMFELELCIKKLVLNNKYLPLLEFEGMYECFEKDYLNLVYNYIGSQKYD